MEINLPGSVTGFKDPTLLGTKTKLTLCELEFSHLYKQIYAMESYSLCKHKLKHLFLCLGMETELFNQS